MSLQLSSLGHSCPSFSLGLPFVTVERKKSLMGSSFSDYVLNTKLPAGVWLGISSGKVRRYHKDLKNKVWRAAADPGGMAADPNPVGRNSGILSIITVNCPYLP